MSTSQSPKIPAADRRADGASSTAAVILDRLAAHNVRYLLGNAGTDFPPLIEAFAAGGTGPDGATPTPMTAPHENLAVAMAHGCYLATGEPQAVMVHVNVGTANALCGMLNARRDRVPMLVMAGRTPIHERGIFGARTVNIHWGQEMFDQAGMVREAVKWDYEMRSGAQAADVIDRALTLAKQQPGGPVYLTLPREVLAAAGTASDAPLPAPIPCAAPDPAAIAQAAEALSGAERPLLITSGYGQNPADVAVLERFLDRHAIGAVGFRARYLHLANDHPCHLGYEPGPLVGDADCLITLDCDVPWIPQLHEPNPDAPVIQIDADPGYGDLPMRSFRADCVIKGDPARALQALDTAMGDVKKPVRAVRQAWLGRHRQAFEELGKRPPSSASLTAEHVADALDGLLKADDVLLTEAPFPIARVRRTQPGTYFGTSSAGGLGWGLGAALGIKLGRKTKDLPGRVVAAIGDGSYMFGNPTPAHFMARAYGLPTLTVILNNRMWGAVRRATLNMYPDGAASRSNDPALTQLSPSPDYEKVVEASGGWGGRVETLDDLAPVLAEGLRQVEGNGVPAVVSVLTEYDDSTAIADSRR